MSRRLKLMAEYGCTPLWEYEEGDLLRIPDPNDLPLSAELKADLNSWAASYDRTLNDDYPPDSGFASPQEEDAFEAEGLRLWRQLQTQLGGAYEVVYYSRHLSRVLDESSMESTRQQIAVAGIAYSESPRIETT